MGARVRLGALAGIVCTLAWGQVIEFESGGLHYQTLTRRGVTVMYAHMPAHVREFAILQVAVSNGAQGPYTIRPEDFRFVRADGSVIQALPARQVVNILLEKGSRNDVIRLVSAYESGLYGIQRMLSTNGYEQRRQAALAEVQSTKVKAAAAASAIALVQIKLTPGQSTDGAVFFSHDGKPLTGGHLVVNTNTDTFEFKGE
ncbi:MAG TPA: hypothetical protein VMT32_18395 [Bryobacteraceae bacterium]|nr:hypothetical protein [Bryobacteraceae bacterium]